MQQQIQSDSRLLFCMITSVLETTGEQHQLNESNQVWNLCFVLIWPSFKGDGVSEGKSRPYILQIYSHVVERFVSAALSALCSFFILQDFHWFPRFTLRTRHLASPTTMVGIKGLVRRTKLKGAIRQHISAACDVLPVFYAAYIKNSHEGMWVSEVYWCWMSNDISHAVKFDLSTVCRCGSRRLHVLHPLGTQSNLHLPSWAILGGFISARLLFLLKPVAFFLPCQAHIIFS